MINTNINVPLRRDMVNEGIRDPIYDGHYNRYDYNPNLTEYFSQTRDPLPKTPAEHINRRKEIKCPTNTPKICDVTMPYQCVISKYPNRCAKTAETFENNPTCYKYCNVYVDQNNLPLSRVKSMNFVHTFDPT